MEKIVQISKSFEEAEHYDIRQNLSMTPDERLTAARELALRVYGENQPDVREYHRIKKATQDSSLSQDLHESKKTSLNHPSPTSPKQSS